jgi:hypothetical protein
MPEPALSGKVLRKRSNLWYVGSWIVLAAWFVLVLVLGSNNFFVARQGAPPLTLLIGFATPVLVFLVSVSRSPAIRELASGSDLKLATGVQAWRLGGYSFLLLYGYGYLPGYFAWPAAVGDMFIGATAPLLLPKMTDPAFVRSRTFIAWNVVGILDLIVAVGMGALGSVLIGNPADVFPTTIMSQMPLVLIPMFFVPLFVMLHLIALLQASRSTK